MAGRRNLPKENPLLAKLLKLADGRSIIQLEGYVGPSENDTVRLYKRLDPSEYVQIPKDAILHFLEIADDSDGRARLFVDSSSTLVLSCARRVEMRASEYAEGGCSAIFPTQRRTLSFIGSLQRCATLLESYEKAKKYLDEHGDTLDVSTRMALENLLLNALVQLQQNCPTALQPLDRL